jgi:hypothetical protein
MLGVIEIVTEIDGVAEGVNPVVTVTVADKEAEAAPVRVEDAARDAETADEATKDGVTEVEVLITLEDPDGLAATLAAELAATLAAELAATLAAELAATLAAELAAREPEDVIEILSETLPLVEALTAKEAEVEADGVAALTDVESLPDTDGDTDGDTELLSL